MFRTLRANLAHIRLTDLQAWLGRFVVWSAAAVTGLTIVLFAKGTEFAIDFFFRLQNDYWWLPLLMTPLVGMLIVWASGWLVGTAGSGIPQTIAALNRAGDASLNRFVSLKIALGKMVLVVAGLAAGFSAGREGPSVQVGASVMHACRRFLPQGFSVDPKHLILAGGAAGISAAFNTPLAGIVFAIEELSRRFEQKTNGVVITAIVLSGLVSISLLGNYTYFGDLTVGSITKAIFLPVIVCGVLCGVLGGIFSRTLLETDASLSKVHSWRKAHPLWWAGACGLLVAMLGIVSNGATFGSGYTLTREMLNGSISETWFYPAIKYLATLFTYLSGIPGGIFAPSLSIGAGIGYDLIPWFGHPEMAAAISALCMTAFLAGVTQAPITSFIIVMEMIDGHEMVISLMAVALIATMVSRLFSRPLYSALSETQLKSLGSHASEDAASPPSRPLG